MRSLFLHFYLIQTQFTLKMLLKQLSVNFLTLYFSKPNGVGCKLFNTLIIHVFMKEFFQNVDFETKSADNTKKHAKLPRRQTVKTVLRGEGVLEEELTGQPCPWEGIEFALFKPYKSPPFCGTKANSVEQDQTLQNTSSGQWLHCLLAEGSFQI